MAQSGRLVHPSELLRSDTNDFSAPRNVDLGLSDFDCGLNAAPWFGRVFQLHKYAKVEIFIVLAAALGCMQGIAFSYFKDTSEAWGMFFNLNGRTSEWIIHCGDMFAGSFGVLISYWGNRHRPTWMGGLAIIHAIVAVILIVPEIYHPKFPKYDVNAASNGTILCISNREFQNNLREDQIITTMEDEKSYIALGVFIFYQLFYSFAIVTYISLGISYIDDHVKYKNSATCICILLVAKESGNQIGAYLAFVPILFNRYTFYSFSWLSVAVCIFIFGTLIAMFSKVLPSKIMQVGAASLLNITEDVQVEELAKLGGYFKQTSQLITNKALMLNIMAASVISIAVVNFDILQAEFYRSWSGYEKISRHAKQTQFVADHITQMVKILSMIASTLIITRLKPSAKLLCTWIFFIYFTTALLFLISLFIRCNNDVHKVANYCNAKCTCDTQYEPICARDATGTGTTYYSPCYAGCVVTNGIDFYNCACINNGGKATLGSCDKDKCALVWTFAQIINALRAGLFASGRVIHILLVLKSIPITHKAIAVGLYFGFVDVFPYAPFKLLYDLLRDHFCESEDGNGFCTIYHKNYAYYAYSITIALAVISTIFAFFLIRSVKHISLYSNDDEDKQMERLNGSCLRLNNASRTETDAANATSWSTNYTDEDIDTGLRQADEGLEGTPGNRPDLTETWL